MPALPQPVLLAQGLMSNSDAPACPDLSLLPAFKLPAPSVIRRLSAIKDLYKLFIFVLFFGSQFRSFLRKY
ncbi:hypothetical protein RZS08_25755, partial [Arthrospira platensis SPKY1]|nr:hypothetical protein [Arthrospira platensis SPKY1]